MFKRKDCNLKFKPLVRKTIVQKLNSIPVASAFSWSVYTSWLDVKWHHLYQRLIHYLVIIPRKPTGQATHHSHHMASCHIWPTSRKKSRESCWVLDGNISRWRFATQQSETYARIFKCWREHVWTTGNCSQYDHGLVRQSETMDLVI